MNQRIFTPYFIFCFVFLFTVDEIQAQDIHYSMFNRSPMNINPGLMGVFGGDLRVTSNYRRQWKSVPVDYKTFTATLEHKFKNGSAKRGYFAGGLHLNYDDEGSLSLAQTQVGIGGSYVYQLTNAAVNKHFLSGGVQLAFSHRNFNLDKLEVDAQFIDDKFDKSNPTLENRLTDKATFFNFSGGINYRYQNLEAGKRTRIDLGGAIYHFNEPEKSFIDGAESNLECRYSFYGFSSFKIRQKVDVGLLASAQFQGPHKEFVIGANGRLYFGKQTAFLLGLSYRTGDRDALIPNLNIDYRHFSFGFSYDWNISRFDVATSGRGGPEFSLIYTVGKIPEDTPACLLF